MKISFAECNYYGTPVDPTALFVFKMSIWNRNGWVRVDYEVIFHSHLEGNARSVVVGFSEGTRWMLIPEFGNFKGTVLWQKFILRDGEKWQLIPLSFNQQFPLGKSLAELNGFCFQIMFKIAVWWCYFEFPKCNHAVMWLMKLRDIAQKLRCTCLGICRDGWAQRTC